jgi:DNA-binding CsgD family transcriptional regulator
LLLPKTSEAEAPVLKTQLTSQEKLVANGFLQGMKPLEVAGRLGISVWTVRNLTMRLRVKLHVQSIAELVELLTREQGLRAEVLKVPLARKRKQPEEVLHLLSLLSAKSDA